jgi:NADPH:quinone reductase-like Zn-dependent oxidoreductase
MQYQAYDLAGTVVSIYGQVEKIDCGSASEFKPCDEVCGMTDVARGSTWAEYVLAETREVAIKPKWLGWAEAVAVPMSTLTVWQALFEVSGLP